MVIAGVPVVIHLALLAVVVLLVFLKRGAMRGVSRRVARSVWCPVRDQQLAAELEEAEWDGKRLDVAQCAAFSPPTAVSCEKACLKITGRPGGPRASGLPIDLIGLVG